MPRYEILTSHDPKDLARQVEEYLKAGWKLVGGLVWDFVPYGTYAQAVYYDGKE